ncbi:MAG: type II secretion system protein GspL [Thermodesulfobacteriota bacterium]
MSSKILSLDIRDNTVSALSIATGLKGNWIEKAAGVEMADAPDDTQDRLIWAIHAVTEQIEVAGAVCLLSIPPSLVTFRNIEVPFRDRKKIRQVLPFELEPSLPYAIDQLTLDFMVVNRADQTDLIAAAVETEKLNHIVETLNRFDINPRYITAGGITSALCYAGLAPSPPEAFLYVDLGANSATVSGVKDGRIHVLRTLKTGRGAPAEKAKRLAGGILRMTASFDTIYDFDFFPEQILVSGIDADDETLLSHLSTAFELPVRPANLMEDTQLHVSALPDAGFDPLRFGGPLGLAGIETDGVAPFNFSREHYAIQKYWVENRNEVITTGMLAVLVFILMMFSVVVEAHFLQNQVSRINQQITGIYRSTFPQDSKIVDPVQQMRVKLEKLEEQQRYSADTGSNIRNIDILNQISQQVPEQIDVIMTRFVRGNNDILLAGTTDTFNAVDEIKGRLEKVDIFQNLTISSANMDQNINRVRFNIKSDLAD